MVCARGTGRMDESRKVTKAIVKGRARGLEVPHKWQTPGADRFMNGSPRNACELLHRRSALYGVAKQCELRSAAAGRTALPRRSAAEGSSEVKLQRQLQFARVVDGGSDLSKRGRTHQGVRSRKVRVVKRIEGLCAELQAHTFTDRA